MLSLNGNKTHEVLGLPSFLQFEEPKIATKALIPFPVFALHEESVLSVYLDPTATITTAN